MHFLSFCFWEGEGSPTKIDYRNKVGTLIRTSPLDLVKHKSVSIRVISFQDARGQANTSQKYRLIWRVRFLVNEVFGCPLRSPLEHGLHAGLRLGDCFFPFFLERFHLQINHRSTLVQWRCFPLSVHGYPFFQHCFWRGAIVFLSFAFFSTAARQARKQPSNLNPLPRAFLRRCPKSGVVCS